MKMILLICLLMTGCAAQRYPFRSHSEIVEMKRELNLAQKKLSKQQAYVVQLEEEIARHQIESIQREISQMDNPEMIKQQTLTQEQWVTFFHEQREILSEIIRNNPSCREQAQNVLDQILTLITQLSD